MRKPIASLLDFSSMQGFIVLYTHTVVDTLFVGAFAAWAIRFSFISCV